MKDFRCSNCNRLLAKVDGGKVQIKCPYCREMNLAVFQKNGQYYNPYFSETTYSKPCK